MRGTRLPLFYLISLFVGLCGYAHAQTDAQTLAKINITARAGEHADFDRIVFDWPRTVTYSMHRTGGQAVLRFGVPANVTFNGFSFLTRAHDFVTSIDKDNNLIVTFTIDPRAELKDFTSGTSVAVDITGAVAPLAAASKSTASATKSAAPPAPAPTTDGHKDAVDTGAPPPVAVTVPASTALVAPQPAPSAPVPTPAFPVPASTATKALPSPANMPTATIEDAKPSTPPTPSGAPSSSTRSSDTNAAPDKKTMMSVPSVDIGDTPLLIAALDPHVAVRAVIWQRGGYGYIIFDRKLTLSLDALTAGQQAPKVTLEPLDLTKSSGFRFIAPDDIEMSATRDGTIWKVFLSKQQPDVPVSTTLVAQPDFALGSRFLLPLPDAPEPIKLLDPVEGDNLVLVPLEQTEAFSVFRRMADFLILPAAQGLVIKPLTDKVVVRAVSDGIEVTAEGGLHLSPATDTGASQQSSQKAKAAAAGKSLFDFAAWRGKPDESFTQTRQRLQQTIVDVPERERNRARLELARFYFSHGNGEEASAMLTWLAKQVPDLVAHADFLALAGAANVLSFRPDDGLKDLQSPLLAGQPEIELWQAVAEAELRNWQDAEDKFSVTETMLIGYPEPFYSRFSVLAIESAVANDKDREAADWLDRLESGPHETSIDPAIVYLHGVLHAKSGRASAAEQAWKEAAASDNHLYKIRAELALIDLGVANGSLTPAQAADRLEALRFGWRGDDLEVDILHRLGQFYVQAKNVKAGLNTLSLAVQLYPNSPMTPKLREEMSQIFHDVFLGDLGKKMSPLDSLTLYQQYRALMPTGADGITTTRNLAERLVAIDLLEQAGDLLEDLVKNKLQGEEKGHVSARLAAIRLLDHKPEAAITALDYSAGESFSPDLQSERLLLRAKALSDEQKDDEALALLKDNNHDAAKLLRADITMHAQHWSDAAKALLDLIGPPPKPGENLKPEQADWLVNCAIAYSLAGDQTGLDRLAIDFGAPMAGMPQNDTFRVLTQPEKSGQLKDITAAQTRISDVNMFQGFLDSYRKSEGGDPAVDVKKP